MYIGYVSKIWNNSSLLAQEWSPMRRILGACENLFWNLIILKIYLNLIGKSMNHQFLGCLLWASSSSLASGRYVFLPPIVVSWISTESQGDFPMYISVSVPQTCSEASLRHPTLRDTVRRKRSFFSEAPGRADGCSTSPEETACIRAWKRLNGHMGEVGQCRRKCGDWCVREKGWWLC